MPGAVGAAARGAIEAGERDGGQPQADLAGVKGVYGTMRLFTRRRRWERGAALRS